ncbi:MAG: helix-turn-helix transcriptional regulator [Candidatus Riflebacteria bacterium]|nr:helix-turn-helix transcriptional regulator [Candidatus Riflebacteria bacterium]
MTKNLTDVVRRHLARLRKDRGWSRAELARRVGVHRSFIARLESDPSRGLNVDTLGALAEAFGVPPAALVGAEEPAQMAVSRGPPGVRYPSGEVVLGKLCRGGRGPDMLAGAYCAVSQDEMSQVAGPGQVLDFFLGKTGDPGPPWSDLLANHVLSVRPCILLEDMRPLIPMSPRSSMLFVENASSVMKEDTVFRPPVKLVVEPRTRLSLLDRGRCGVHQALYVFVPRQADLALAERLLMRIAAVFMGIPGEMLAPSVPWDQRSRRPRVAEYMSITLPKSITSFNWAWSEVDKELGVLSEVAPSEAHEVDENDIVGMCIRLREDLRRGTDLTRKIKHAMQSE